MSESIFQFHENNMYTAEKMKAHIEFEDEFEKIQSRHGDEYKELENKYDYERKELKRRYDNEREKLKNRHYQEIKKLISNRLRRQNRQSSRRQGTKRLVSRPSKYPTPSNPSGKQKDINLSPTTKQPSQHLSYNTCTPSGPSRKPTNESPSQHLSCYSSSETNLNLEEWPNDGSYDCTLSTRDPPVFNEMRYPGNSPFGYLIHTYNHENSTLIRDDQKNITRSQYSNIDMTNANDGSYLDRMGN
ncbi:13703_t:CDS:2 [Dentiscutata erythropus]|uniref:13703_t:CDS:1 n=1 Tax=Dentiscutata erythropus TaxID=1348616 RepID=A0A9N9I4G7_9GLOM|nr:13703_t:CDS:2 [Dentiscutata erythropus]